MSPADFRQGLQAAVAERPSISERSTLPLNAFSEFEGGPNVKAVEKQADAPPSATAEEFLSQSLHHIRKASNGLRLLQIVMGAQLPSCVLIFVPRRG